MMESEGRKIERRERREMEANFACQDFCVCVCLRGRERERFFAYQTGSGSLTIAF